MAYNPSFLLKRISHDGVLEKYLNGCYSDNVSNNSIKIFSKSAIVTEEFSQDPYSAIFTYGLSKYSSPVYVSSNQTAVDVYRFDEAPQEKLDCDWCHEYFDHDPCGMVVAYLKCYYTDPETNKCYIKETFWTYGNHCSMECAYGELWFTRRLGSTNTSIDCESSIIYTKLLFEKSTGKDVKEFIPTPYFRLLKSRGGTLERSEGHSYIPSGHIILVPAKIVFEKTA